MLLTNLETPITLLNLQEIGINLDLYQNKIKKLYDHYEWDYYLLNQNKIDLLRKTLGHNFFVGIDNKTLLEVYQNKESFNDFLKRFNILDETELDKFNSILPTRKRCISQFLLYYDKTWQIERIDSLNFKQKNALITNEENFDFRKYERKFKELPSQYVDNDLFNILIK